MSEKSLLGDVFFDGYKVTEKIGAGAFGTVYKVEKRDASGEYTRALKHITIPSSKQQYDSVFNSMGGDASKVEDYFSAMLRGIVSEIQILNDLSEKGATNIVRYYAHNIVTSENPKQYDIYILMEYLTPLTNYISAKSFAVKDVVALGLDILKALELCHGNGVIHRDIKDDNVFVAANGEYKIGDFGVSKVLKGSAKAESVKGTPNFIAPEVYLNKEGYTQSVDLYSLGIVLYRLLNYNRNPFLPTFPLPYEPEDEDAAFNERMKGCVPSLPAMGEADIGNVIIKAVSGKTDRFSSASKFRIALQKAVDNTADSVLSTTVNIVSKSKEENQQTYSESNKKGFEATIKETVGAEETFSSEPQEITSETNKRLFETVGEVYNPPVPGAASNIADEPKEKDKKNSRAK
ncbi:MAG: protein kinase, partial [Tannerella sp.]|nr:protein kinase [Tannerella sp.]